MRDIHPPCRAGLLTSPPSLQLQERLGPWNLRNIRGLGVPPCVLRYWGFRASFQPIFLENAAHNIAEYGMSRPAGRRRRRQAVSHTRTPVCAAISEFSAGFEAGFARYRSTVLNTPTKSAPSTTPPTLQKCSAQRANTKHPSSVLRFVEEGRGSGGKHPDIAARTASGRGAR